MNKTQIQSYWESESYQYVINIVHYLNKTNNIKIKPGRLITGNWKKLITSLDYIYNSKNEVHKIMYDFEKVIKAQLDYFERFKKIYLYYKDVSKTKSLSECEFFYRWVEGMKIIKNNIIENDKITESKTLLHFNNKYKEKEKSDEWRSYKDYTEYGAIQGTKTYNYMVDCIFRKVFMVLDDINLDKYKDDIQFFIYSLINMKKLNYETPFLVNEFKLLFFHPKTNVVT